MGKIDRNCPFFISQNDRNGDMAIFCCTLMQGEQDHEGNCGAYPCPKETLESCSRNKEMTLQFCLDCMADASKKTCRPLYGQVKQPLLNLIKLRRFAECKEHENCITCGLEAKCSSMVLLNMGYVSSKEKCGDVIGYLKYLVGDEESQDKTSDSVSDDAINERHTWENFKCDVKIALAKSESVFENSNGHFEDAKKVFLKYLADLG